MTDNSPDALIDKMVKDMDSQDSRDKKWLAFLLLIGLSYLYIYRLMHVRVPKGSQIAIKRSLKSTYRVKFAQMNKRIARWRKHYRAKVKAKLMSEAEAKIKFARMRYLIMRSEATDILNRTLEKNFLALGLKKYKYQTQKDDRVRCLHRTRQSKVYKIGHRFEDGLIGEAHGCRCYMSAPKA